MSSSLKEDWEIFCMLVLESRPRTCTPSRFVTRIPKVGLQQQPTSSNLHQPVVVDQLTCASVPYLICAPLSQVFR